MLPRRGSAQVEERLENTANQGGADRCRQPPPLVQGGPFPSIRRIEMGNARKLAAALLVALAALPGALSAQSTGTITGRVTAAENQQPLAGATVSVSGTTRRTVTDAQGNYTL